MNRPLKVHRWMPVFMAMPRMIRELERDPESGFLGATQSLQADARAVLAQLRAAGALRARPRRLALPRLEAFNQRVRASGDVGIWHETYRVRDGEYETIYGNMPRRGLAKVGAHVPLGSTSTAARRLGARPDDRAPVEGY